MNLPGPHLLDIGEFQQTQIARARTVGVAFFLGLPDLWYEKPGPLWLCQNGHLSRTYLKSEKLGRHVCLGCSNQIMLIDPTTTEETITHWMQHSTLPEESP